MKRPPVVLLIVAGAGILAGLVAQNAIPVGVFHDDGQYVILARSIAEHGTYRFDNLPGSPPGLHYPPGYPLVLSLVWMVAPGNIQALRLANALLLGAAALAIYACARSAFGLKERASAIVAVGVVASAPFVWFNSLLISETLFVTVLCATFAFAAGRRDAGVGAHIGIGALAACTALVRSLGDPVGPLLIVERALRRRWRDAGLIAAGWLVILAPWKVWLAAHSGDMPAPIAGAYGEYGAWWRAAVDAHGSQFVFETALKNISQLPITFSVLGWGNVPVMKWIAPLIVLAVVAAGMWHARKSAGVVALYGILYAAVVLIWPFDPDRFLLMLLPFVAAAFAVGAREITAGVMARDVAVRATAGVLALVLVAGVSQTYWSAARTQPWTRGLGERGRAGLAAAKVVDQLPPNARIASDFDEVVHLATGRGAVPALGLTAAQYVRPAVDSANGARLRELIDTFRLTHVVVADVPTLGAVTWLNSHGFPLVAVAQDSGGAIAYAIAPPRAAPPTPAAK